MSDELFEYRFNLYRSDQLSNICSARLIILTHPRARNFYATGSRELRPEGAEGGNEDARIDDFEPYDDSFGLLMMEKCR